MRYDSQFAAIERRITQPINAFIDFDLQRDKITVRASDDDTGVGDDGFDYSS